MKKTRRELLLEANQMLGQNGFLWNGTPKKEYRKDQGFFEKKILVTPMGNGSR